MEKFSPEDKYDKLRLAIWQTFERTLIVQPLGGLLCPADFLSVAVAALFLPVRNGFFLFWPCFLKVLQALQSRPEEDIQNPNVCLMSGLSDRAGLPDRILQVSLELEADSAEGSGEKKSKKRFLPNDSYGTSRLQMPFSLSPYLWPNVQA